MVSSLIFAHGNLCIIKFVISDAIQATYWKDPTSTNVQMGAGLQVLQFLSVKVP